jgi:Zn-finger protein
MRARQFLQDHLYPFCFCHLWPHQQDGDGRWMFKIPGPEVSLYDDGSMFKRKHLAREGTKRRSRNTVSDNSGGCDLSADLFQDVKKNAFH